MSAKCDICAITGAKRFGLTHRTKGTTRGVGSIALCTKCWKQVTEGHRYKRFPGRCAKGLHEMTGSNLGIHADGHRICLACRRIANDKYNAKQRALRAARGLRGRAPTPAQRQVQSERLREWAARRAA